MRWRRALAAICIALPAMPAMAQGFERGTATLGLMLGGAEQLQRSYTLISVRGGYYVRDGVETSLALETWTGNSPRITKVIPELRRVFHANPGVRPYLAGFVARSDYEGPIAEINSYGAKAGAYFRMSRNAFLGAGFVHERFANCDPLVYIDCRQTFAELSLHFVL